MKFYKLFYFIVVLIFINSNNNVIFVKSQTNKDVECGDISNNSNQYFSVFNLAKQLTITTPLTSTLTGASIQTPSTSTKSSNKTCEYYNSKNTIINADIINLGDQAKDIFNSLVVQHYLMLNGTLSVAKGSNINVACVDTSNNQCFNTKELELSGHLLITNQLSSINVQSDINIYQTGLLSTNNGFSTNQQSKIVSQNNINNNGGTININQPISIQSKLLNINSNGQMNINSVDSTINSPITVKGSSKLFITNSNTELVNNNLNIYDSSFVQLTNNIKNNNNNLIFKSLLINLDNEKSLLNSNGNNLINVENFHSNGIVNLNSSSFQINKSFKMGSTSHLNILNDGGLFSNSDIDISGKVNIDESFFSSNIGSFNLLDTSVFKTTQSTININSNISVEGNSLFQNDNCKLFTFLSLGLQLTDQSKIMFGNCSKIQLESISSILNKQSEFHLSKKSNILINSPLSLNDQSKLVIDEQSQHTQSNKDIELNNDSSIKINSKSILMATDNVFFNLNHQSNLFVDQSSILNLSNNCTMNLIDSSRLSVSNNSYIGLIGGKIMINVNSSIQLSDNSNIEIANGSQMEINGNTKLMKSKFQIESSNILLNGQLSLNDDSTTQIYQNTEFLISSIGSIILNNSVIKNYNNLNNEGIIKLMGSSTQFYNDGMVILNGTNSKILYDDNDNHIIYNNNIWVFNNNAINNLKKFINNGTINFSSSVNFNSFNSTIDSTINLLNSSKITINNTLIHNGNIIGNGIINTNIYSSSNSSIGNKDIVSKITINGSLTQKLESEFHIVINGNKTEGEDYTIINILGNFNPNIDGKELDIEKSSSSLPLPTLSSSTDSMDTSKNIGRSILSLLLSSMSSTENSKESSFNNNNNNNQNSSINSNSTSLSSNNYDNNTEIDESNDENLTGKQNKTINVYLSNNQTSGNITFLKTQSQTLQPDLHFKLKIHTFDPETNSYKRIQDKCKYQISQNRQTLSVLISPTRTCEVVVDSDGNPVTDSKGEPIIQNGNESIVSSNSNIKFIVIGIVLSVVFVALIIGIIIYKQRKISNFIKIKRETLFRKMSH